MVDQLAMYFGYFVSVVILLIVFVAVCEFIGDYRYHLKWTKRHKEQLENT